MQPATYHFFVNLIRLLRGVLSASETYIRTRRDQEQEEIKETILHESTETQQQDASLMRPSIRHETNRSTSSLGTTRKGDEL